MTYIYLDIETIPDERENVRDYFRKQVEPPGNLKKAETIAKWDIDDRPESENKAVRSLALNPWFARVVCVCLAVDDGPVVSFSGEEGLILRKFYNLMHDRRQNHNGYGTEIFVGHNIMFDIRVLHARFLVNRITPPRLPFNAKPWSDSIFDTSNIFQDNQMRISMEKLCLAFGINGKGDFDGSQVFDAWNAGEIEKIKSYCMDDVDRVRSIHKIITGRA